MFVPRQLQQFTSPHLEDDTALVLGGVPGSDNGDRCEVGWWWGFDDAGSLESSSGEGVSVLACTSRVRGQGSCERGESHACAKVFDLEPTGVGVSGPQRGDDEVEPHECADSNESREERVVHGESGTAGASMLPTVVAVR